MWDRDAVHARLAQYFGAECSLKVWHDPRQKSMGLRLSQSGFDVLTNSLDLQFWCFPIDAKILHPRNLLRLDRYLGCPYYLRRQQRQFELVLLGDRESIMATMYGDVERFISSLCDQ